MSLPLLLLVALGAPAASTPPVITYEPSEPRPGELFVVRVRGAQSEMRIEVGGREFASFARSGQEQVALAGLSVDTVPGPVPLSVFHEVGGLPYQLMVELGVPKRVFDESRLKVKDEFVKLPKELRERVSKDRERVRAAWRQTGPLPLWRGAFRPPSEQKITGVYGTRRVFNGKRNSTHRGLDFDGKVGDPIQAMNHGRVVMAEELYYTGNTVFVDHGLGLFTVYFHLSEYAVKLGDVVTPGQLLGKVGATGRVTGPHLHLGVRLGASYYDPQSLLDLGPVLAELP